MRLCGGYYSKSLQFSNYQIILLTTQLIVTGRKKFNKNDIE